MALTKTRVHSMSYAGTVTTVDDVECRSRPRSAESTTTTTRPRTVSRASHGLPQWLDAKRAPTPNAKDNMTIAVPGRLMKLALPGRVVANSGGLLRLHCDDSIAQAPHRASRRRTSRACRPLRPRASLQPSAEALPVLRESGRGSGAIPSGVVQQPALGNARGCIHVRAVPGR